MLVFDEFDLPLLLLVALPPDVDVLLQLVHNDVFMVVELILMEPFTPASLWLCAYDTWTQFVYFLQWQLLSYPDLFFLLLAPFLIVQFYNSQIFKLELFFITLVVFSIDTLGSIISYFVQLFIVLLLLDEGFLFPIILCPDLDVLVDEIPKQDYLGDKIFTQFNSVLVELQLLNFHFPHEKVHVVAVAEKRVLFLLEVEFLTQIEGAKTAFNHGILLPVVNFSF